MAAVGVVAQQRWRLIHIDDQNVDVTIVVEVSKGAATAGVKCRDAGSRFIDQFLKPAAPKIAEHEPRRFPRIVRQLLLNAGIHVSGDQKQIGKTIIVQVDNARSPSDVLRLHA